MKKEFNVKTSKWEAVRNGNYVDGKFFFSEIRGKWVAVTSFGFELQRKYFSTKESAIEWLKGECDFIVTQF